MHVYGVARLFQASGPERFKSGVMHSLFAGFRPLLVRILYHLCFSPSDVISRCYKLFNPEQQLLSLQTNGYAFRSLAAALHLCRHSLARLPVSHHFYNKLIRFYHRNMKRASVDRPLYVIPIWNLFWIWRGGSNRYATIIQGASVMVFSIRNLGHLLLLDAAYRSLTLRWQICTRICGLSALSVLLSWVVYSRCFR